MSMKGEKRKMRKLVKKIATVALAASMTAAMSVSAFAADFYQFVGNPNLLTREMIRLDGFQQLIHRILQQ